MRAATIALLLCTFVLVHDVTGQYGYGKGFGPGKWWSKVFKYGFYPVSTARRVVWARFGLNPFEYTLHMDWAIGAWWNFSRGRYTRYRVFFRIQRKAFPFNWYTCRGWMGRPKFGPPFFIGFPFWNRCW